MFRSAERSRAMRNAMAPASFDLGPIFLAPATGSPVAEKIDRTWL
jgi:hypothetical protein